MVEELKAMASSIRKQTEENLKQLDILTQMIARYEQQEDDRWVTTAEASQLLGRPSRTIRQAAEDKKIRSRRKGVRNLEVNLADCTKLFKAV